MSPFFLRIRIGRHDFIVTFVIIVEPRTGLNHDRVDEMWVVLGRVSKKMSAFGPVFLRIRIGRHDFIITFVIIV